MMSGSNSREDLESALKKAAKSLDGEKRAAIKKAKGTKGKKAKEALAAVEDEYAVKLKELEAKHQERLEDLEGGKNNEENQPQAQQPKLAGGEEEKVKVKAEVISEKQKKQEKARRKKERQKEKEKQRQEELEREEANAGPSLRQVELDQIQAVLTPLNLEVAEVEADGHCLYRAVAAQTNRDYQEIRALCADTLQANKDDFAPFCEFTEDVASFDVYVDRVRSSAEWGGHLELRALGMALDLPILVYSVQSGSKPLGIHDDDEERNDDGKNNKTPIRLSYHLHYYALGEHYNQVVEA